MELEEAIKICRNLIDTLGTGLVKFGGKIDLSSKDIGYMEAIEIQALENSISKQKIEDKIKYWEELMGNYCKRKEYGQVDIATYKIKILQELLEDK